MREKDVEGRSRQRALRDDARSRERLHEKGCSLEFLHLVDELYPALLPERQAFRRGPDSRAGLVERQKFRHLAEIGLGKRLTPAVSHTERSCPRTSS
jgi:hypothetical protein